MFSNAIFGRAIINQSQTFFPSDQQTPRAAAAPASSTSQQNCFFDKIRHSRMRFLLLWMALTLLPLASLYVLSKEIALGDLWYVDNVVVVKEQQPAQPREPPTSPPWNQVQKRLWKLQHHQAPLTEDKKRNARRHFFLRGRRGGDDENHKMMIGWDMGDDPKVRKWVERKQKEEAAKQQKEKPRLLQVNAQKELSHPHAGALDVHGNSGYVADPTALRRGRLEYLKSLDSEKERLRNENMVASNTKNKNNNNNADDEDGFWSALSGYEKQYRNGTRTGGQILTPKFICAFGPGRGMEEDSGYKLLTEKIRIFEGNYETLDESSTGDLKGKDSVDSKSPKEPRGTDPIVSSSSKRARVLCAIYTHSEQRDLARTQALLWGYKCDGFVAFSNETIPSLGLVNLIHAGDESYNNMWQKTRSIWAYIYDNYLNDYDYFHLGGDDMYVLVENLRLFLHKVQNEQQAGLGFDVSETSRDGDPVSPNTQQPLFIGQWVGQPLNSELPLPSNHTYMVSGGPGYTLNAAAVKRFVEDALPSCHVNDKVAYEDKLISACFRQLGIVGHDTREEISGEQQYHGTNPAQLYSSRASNHRRASYHARLAYYWQGLQHPSKELSSAVGPKNQLEAVATHSVSFHDLYTPTYATRVHAILYNKVCPNNTPLGLALQRKVF